MKTRKSARLAWLCAGLCWVLAIGTTGLYVLNEIGLGVPEDSTPQSMNMVMAITFPPVGALILSRKPRHAVGWVFLAIGLGQAVGQFSLQYAFYTVETAPGTLPFGRAAFLVQDTIWFPSFGLFIVLLALFPDGYPLSIRWRWLLWMVGGAFGIFILSLFVAALTDPRPLRFISAPADSFGVEDVIFDVSVDLLLLSLVAAVISLSLRFRRSTGVERQQLKWFALAGLIFMAVFTLLSVLSAWPVLDASILHQREYGIARGVLAALFPLAAACLPAAVGMAILRFRLQEGIDRRFFRKKYNTEQTLAEFGESLRDEVDLSTLVGRIEAVVQETLQPENVILWLREPAREPALRERAALDG